MLEFLLHDMTRIRDRRRILAAEKLFLNGDSMTEAARSAGIAVQSLEGVRRLLSATHARLSLVYPSKPCPLDPLDKRPAANSGSL